MAYLVTLARIGSDDAATTEFITPPVLGLAGGAPCSAPSVVTVRPAEATPAMLASAIQERHRRRGGAHRQGQARHPAAGRERQHGADDGQRRHPMAAEDHVRSIHVFNEKNPQPNIANFHLGPRAGRAQVSTRIRLADTQKVVAIARLSDGIVLVGQRRCHRDARRLHRGGDLMASALINVPAKAKRGDIIEIKTLMSHIMETGYRHTADRRSRFRATSSRALPAAINGDGDFPRRPVSGHRRQSVHHLLHDGDRERQVRVRMDRRQRLFRNRICLDHGRMRLAAP